MDIIHVNRLLDKLEEVKMEIRDLNQTIRNTFSEPIEVIQRKAPRKKKVVKKDDKPNTTS